MWKNSWTIDTSAKDPPAWTASGSTVGSLPSSSIGGPSSAISLGKYLFAIRAAAAISAVALASAHAQIRTLAMTARVLRHPAVHSVASLGSAADAFNAGPGVL